MIGLKANWQWTSTAVFMLILLILNSFLCSLASRHLLSTWTGMTFTLEATWICLETPTSCLDTNSWFAPTVCVFTKLFDQICNLFSWWIPKKSISRLTSIVQTVVFDLLLRFILPYHQYNNSRLEKILTQTFLLGSGKYLELKTRFVGIPQRFCSLDDSSCNPEKLASAYGSV